MQKNVRFCAAPSVFKKPMLKRSGGEKTLSNRVCKINPDFAKKSKSRADF